MTDTPMPLATTVLYVNDVARVVEFYRHALGLEPRLYDEENGFAELGEDGRIAVASHQAGSLMMDGSYPKSKDGRVTGAELAFYAADVQDAFDRAVAAGGRPITAPRQMPWGQTVAYVEDPAGMVLGFVTKMGENAV